MSLPNIKINPAYERKGMCIMEEEKKKAILKVSGILCRKLSGV